MQRLRGSSGNVRLSHLLMSFFCYSPSQTGRRRHLFSCSTFVDPFVPLLANLWTQYFEQEWSDYDANGRKPSMGQGWNDPLWMPGGQKSRSHEAENRFGDLADASFSTPLGRVAFLVGYVMVFRCRCVWLAEKTVNVVASSGLSPVCAWKSTGRQLIQAMIRCYLLKLNFD